MSVDVDKQLDRAKRFIEKNRIQEAMEAYHSVLDAVPNHLEALQALGDLYSRQNQFDRAANYYGMLFDRFVPSGEEAKALALYSRFLKQQQQPPERVARFAMLLQKQNRIEEAIEQFLAAALAFELGGKGEEALATFVRVSQLDPDNADRHMAVADLAERLGDPVVASRAYLRAGQLTTENEAKALELFGNAHRLAPGDRSTTLFYAQAILRQGDAARAADLLAPLADTEQDATFLETYCDALTRSGQYGAARGVLEQLAQKGAVPFEKLLSLSSEYMRTGQEENAVDLLRTAMKGMVAERRETEFASAVDRLIETYPQSLRLAEFCGAMYSSLNRETKYFDALVRLFDLYMQNNQLSGACESLDRLMEIDPYDSRNQRRMELLEGKADSAFLSRLRSRLMNTSTHGASTPQMEAPRAGNQEPSRVAPEEGQDAQTLEDLLVQAEIFVQYSLQTKAVERLQKIVDLFPGEESRNTRLKSLFDAVHWWPGQVAGQSAPPRQETPPTEPAKRTAAFAPETLRDLTKISEINQNIFRQPSPRAMLSVTVNEVGNYLRATRCLAVVGAAGQPPQMASEFCAPGVEGASGAQIVRMIGQLGRVAPNALGGQSLEASAAPALKEMGLETVLGVQLTDPETQTESGMLIVGFAGPHSWKPNETYFLQSIGDQMLLCVQHTRLRSLVRNLSVADEKTGLLARSSYQDCLLHESQRARTKGTSLALALLQIDGGQELARQQGEAPLERYMEQLARAVQTIVRQSDLAVKYTSWALAFILPDTPLSGARTLAQKLRKTVGRVRPPWNGKPVTMSIAIVEALVRQEFDNEDIVTDLINRAEEGLEEARRGGGNAVVALERAGG
jgi:diguanylate cyclase (GGDEF)-like protein